MDCDGARLSTIVTDALKEYAEKGATEKSEPAQSTSSKSKRSQRLRKRRNAFRLLSASSLFSTSQRNVPMNFGKC